VSAPATKPLPLVLLGDPTATACEGDACAVPEPTERRIVTEALDNDRL